MSTLTDTEKQGLRHFFQNQEDPTLVFQIAKSVTKNLAAIETEEEALDIIFLHSGNIIALLNKRMITKELLFKYLHQNKVALGEDLTKVSLITKIQDFWKSQSFESSDERHAHTETEIEESSYPIHLLARKFSEWFFKNYNENSLKVDDFWCDVRLDLRIIANDGVNDQQSTSNENVLDSLQQIKQQFNFYFNPNITHEGVQGRVDIHGLVLVLSCGTLHTLNRCVGVFESTFGLMRDPFSENNWKMKTIQFLLRSADLITSHSLNQSESVKEYLMLPAPPDVSD